MGWFRSAGPKATDPVTDLREAIEHLQAGIVTNLTAEYSSRVPPKEALTMAMCALSYAMAVDPIGEEAQAFHSQYPEVVLREASALADNGRVRPALSNLYAGLTILSAIQTRDPFSAAAAELGERATSLSVYIPNTYDICGSEDALQCIAALHSYAKQYLAESFIPQPNRR